MTIQKTEARSFDGIAPKIEKTSRELSCDLNQVEWENRVREFADSQRKTEATKDRKKSVMAELSADLKVAELTESKLAGIVTNKREQREVTVEVLSDYEKGIVVEKRTDTNEVISTRDMTTMERQGGLFDELDESNITDANDFIEKAHKGDK